MLRQTRWFMVLALVAMFIVVQACGDDKPATPPGQQAEEKKAEGDEAKKDEAEKAEAGKDEPTAEDGKPAPAEGDKPDDGQPGEGEAAKVAGEEVVKRKAPNVQLERTLRKVVAYGVTGPIDTTKNKVIDLLPPQIKGMAQMGWGMGLSDLASKAGLKNLDWLDTSRGIGFALEGKDRPLLAIPVKSEEAFRAAIPDSMEADENMGYQVEDAYLFPYGKFVLMSDSYRTIDLIEGDLKLELTRLTTDKVFKIVLGGPSLHTLLSSLLDEVERNMGETIPMQQEQKEFLARLFNFVKEMVGELDEVSVSMDVAGNDLVIRYDVVPLEGSKIAASLAAMKPGQFKSATYLPVKSFLVFAQYVPPEVYAPWLPRYVDLMSVAWKLSPEEKAKFGKLYAELISFYGADSAFAIYSDSSFPLCMSGVANMKDGLKARDKIYEFYAMLFERTMDELPPENRAMFENRSFKEIVDGLAPVFANLGIVLKMENEEYRGGMVDYLLVTFDWEKLKLPPDAAWIPQVIQKQLGFAFGFSAQHMVASFGPNAIVRAKEVLDKSAGFDLKTLFGDTFDETQYSGVFGMSVPRLVESLLEIQILAELAEGQEWIPLLKKSRGFLAYSGTKENTGWLEAHLDIKSIVDVAAPIMMKEFGGTKAPIEAPAAIEVVTEPAK